MKFFSTDRVNSCIFWSLTCIYLVDDVFDVFIGLCLLVFGRSHFYFFGSIICIFSKNFFFLIDALIFFQSITCVLLSITWIFGLVTFIFWKNCIFWSINKIFQSMTCIFLSTTCIFGSITLIFSKNCIFWSMNKIFFSRWFAFFFVDYLHFWIDNLHF